MRAFLFGNSHERLLPADHCCSCTIQRETGSLRWGANPMAASWRAMVGTGASLHGNDAAARQLRTPGQELATAEGPGNLTPLAASPCYLR